MNRILAIAEPSTHTPSACLHGNVQQYPLRVPLNHTEIARGRAKQRFS
jgi:hypothetical protein